MTDFLERIGSFTSDIGAEIAAFDSATNAVFMVSGDTEVQLLSLADPHNPDLLSVLDVADFIPNIDGVNSVAVANGVVAIAVSADPQTDPGFVAVADIDAVIAGEPNAFQVVQVGALPDNVVFSPDGTKLLTANEGEPDDGVDPNGSISIIDISGGLTGISQASVTTVGFEAFNGRENDLRADGVRIFPDATVAQDLEPEYVAVSPDGTQAFVTLQENNALAVINLATNEVEGIVPLGLKDFSQVGLDASDRDGGINIDTEPVFGMYMPDSIASFEVNGQTFYITANEGDDRGDADEDARGDAIRVGDLGDVTSFGRSGLSLDERFDPAIADDENLGRLTISSIDGDIDGDGDIDQLFSYGARSFSIWDDNGNQVFDSGSQIAEITAELTPDLFNANDGDPAEVDNRSDNKGAEPEAVTVGEIGGRPFAFVGLERAGGGVLVYDLSDPTNPEFVQYARSDEDIAPEGLTFISAEDSPTGQPLLTIANEESNTFAVYETNVQAATISEIQGASHVSPLEGELVQTEGIVTAVDFRGFYVQSAVDDGNDATSEGLFISTSGSPTVSIGDEVRLFGEVSEVVSRTNELSTTQLIDPDVVILSSGNDLPEATVIGESGRVAPSEIVISDDELPVNLQEPGGNFDPDEDAIDFYESLEGMRVTVEDAVAVSPTRVFGRFSAEAVTLPNQGAGVTPEDGLTARGSINLNSGPDNTGDQNPERVQIQFNPNLLPEGFDTPALTVGDQLGDVTGVVGYSFGNFEVNVTEEFDITPSGLEQEVTDLVGGDNDLTVASYNVLNLAADGTDTAQFELLGQQVVNNLNSPDIIALQEIQDDSGVTNDGTVDATATLQALVDAIAAAGGPTYEFFDVAPEDGTQGGVPGGNIRNAYLYNPDRVTLDSFATIDQAPAFDGTRLPLVANFEFNGNLVTVVNNHLTSRFGSSPVYGGPQPFVQAGEEEREAQAQALNDFVDNIVATNPDAKVIVLGDLNTFEFTNDLAEILPGTGDERVLTNLVDQAVADDDAYTFIFDGNSQVLDHIFVTDSLLDGAEFDIVHVNNDFPRDDNGAQFTDTVVASDHEPLVARFTLEETVTAPSTFTLQLLHAADQEAGIPALEDAPRFSAVLNALRDDFDNTITLSSGDAIIPGLFFSASEEAFGGAGRADILIQNELGFEAIAFGNHEFDLDTDLVRDLIAGAEDDPTTPDVDESFEGALFPYLSSNLDFSTDENLADLVVPDDQAPEPNSIAATTVIDVVGEQIGVVGATTPTINNVNVRISNPGDVTVLPQPFDGVPTSEQLDALAAEIQQDVDEMLALNPGLNKVIVLSHMQQIGIEQELATRLSNVDVIVAGGSNTRLFDENDRPRDGDTDQGTYPIFTTDADGNPVAIVNTDGNYKYVGRLVIDFDENGIIIPESYDSEVSGAYATDEQGVADLNAENLVDPDIQEIVDALEEVIVAKESNVFGVSDVYLNGVRGSVRTQETNLGNLTADANLAIAKETDSDVVISIKNGGGIRDDIGRVVVPAGGTGEPDLLPNEEIPGVKPEGGISENDIVNSLRFNNGLTLLTITAEELLAVIEHGIAASSPDDSNTQGRFPQVSGLEFSFDLTADPNDRVQSLVVLDEDGNDADVIVQNGELVGDPSRTFRMVTLNFLAGGGDGYPFPDRDVVQLAQEDDAARTGAATFAPDGSEQDALAEYLAANFGTEETAFNNADAGREEDTRIQNLAFREDTVIDGGSNGGGNGGVEPDADVVGTDAADTLAGGEGDQTISGGDGDDILRGDLNNRYPQGRRGGDDAIFGGAGNDRIGGKGGDDLLFGDEGDDLIWGDDGDDLLHGGVGNDTLTGDNFSGGQGSDTFAFAVGHGTDTITDFEVGTDFIGLLGDLSFGAITQTVQGNDLLLSTGGENLAVVQNVTTLLDETSFTQLIA
ncbi:choice-of-anchor I family protein [Leptothoe sp. LEGE 181152]|nr:choice-of-anchor I family protein [Leptothoe sp. LEGE 181152]